VGYQFPEPTREDIPPNRYDPNWLQVTIHATHANGSWSATQPCLLTWEFDKLIQWLSQIAAGQTVDTPLRFTEPNLGFVLAGENARILRVFIGHELLPDWHAAQFGKTSRLSLDFEFTPEDLATSINLLRAELEQYPARDDQYNPVP